MSNKIQKIDEPTTFIDAVQNSLHDMEASGGLEVPKNYSVKNALTSAMLIIQDIEDKNHKPAINVCKRSSIQNSLISMVLQGLNPAMSQCYFIVYGNQLQMRRSYFGTVTALKRLPEIKDVTAQVVHEGDTFEIGSNANFETVVTKFEPKIENQDAAIADAFAVITLSDDSKSYTIMTKKEIDQSWAQTRQRANKIQQNFAQEMAKRTVLNRAAKMYINTADDSQLIAGAINTTTQNEYSDDVERKDITPDTVKADSLMKEALGGDDNADNDSEPQADEG